MLEKRISLINSNTGENPSIGQFGEETPSGNLDLSSLDLDDELAAAGIDMEDDDPDLTDFDIEAEIAKLDQVEEGIREADVSTQPKMPPKGVAQAVKAPAGYQPPPGTPAPRAVPVAQAISTPRPGSGAVRIAEPATGECPVVAKVVAPPRTKTAMPAEMPRAAASKAPSEALESEDGPSHSEKRQRSWEQMRTRILIVDDEVQIAQLLERSVPQNSIVKIVKNSFVALQSLETFRPDIILLDLSMPEFSGFDFMEVIRKDKRWDFTRIIVVSGRVAVEERVKAYQAGADDFIGKPFNPREVCHKVRRWARFCRTEEVSDLKSSFLDLINDPDNSPFGPVVLVSEVLGHLHGLSGQILDAAKDMERTCEDFIKRLALMQEYVDWHSEVIALNVVKFSAKAFLSPLLSAWDEQCKQLNLTLICDSIPKDVQIRVDSPSVKRVVRWVFNNAAEHAKRTVKINAGRIGPDFYLDFTDDGKGFPPELLPLVFQGFNPGTKFLVPQKAGLHLSLAQAILEYQGGSITVLDPGPDSTTLRIVLPADQGQS